MTTAYHSGNRTQLITAVINASDTLSEDVHIGSGRFTSVFVPNVTSCALYVRAAPTDAGSYYRVQNTNGVGDFTLPCSAGLVVYSLPERFTALDHVKFESSVTQASTVVLNIIVGW